MITTGAGSEVSGRRLINFKTMTKKFKRIRKMLKLSKNIDAQGSPVDSFSYEPGVGLTLNVDWWPEKTVLITEDCLKKAEVRRNEITVEGPASEYYMLDFFGIRKPITGL